MRFLEITPGHKIDLASQGTLPESVHVFDRESVDAINAALAARRPLLVRGEPGIGKSQLARAAAKTLKRAYVQHVVDSRTESRDLLWHFDAVERLAEAQLLGAAREGRAAVRRRLAVEHYLRPGPLWWAFDWSDAARQAREVCAPAPPQPDGGDPSNGCVILVDEIDKAESDVPNGLLEALGAGEFTPLGRRSPVTAPTVAPLVVITTNEERALPDAFVRRCLVLHLDLPEDEAKLLEWLVERGRAHFPEPELLVLESAAKQLAKDRKTAKDAHRLPLPGQAEYLDLVRAVCALAPGNSDKQVETLERIACYVLGKHQ